MKINKLLQLLRDNATLRGEGPLPKLRMEAAADEVHVYVYDVIDSWYGASALALAAALKEAGTRPVALHINSPGGDIFEGTAMASEIANYQGRVVAHIDGMAASAATRVALAAAEVRMSDSALMMVHEGWTWAMGNKRQLRATADLLEKVDGTIIADYARKTKATAEQVTAWIEAETWFTAAEALAAGFIDAIDSTTQADRDPDAQASAARWNLSAYRNAPQLPKPPAPAEPSLAEQVVKQLAANRNRLRVLAPA